MYYVSAVTCVSTACRLCIATQGSMAHATASTSARKVVMVTANPSVSTTVGGLVGVWASEVFHPWLVFLDAGYEVTLASPLGGKVELDGLSDPRHESGYSAHDIISLGFLSHAKFKDALSSTVKLSDVDVNAFDAIMVCGGQSPMFTFKGDATLKAKLEAFYAKGKVTAALCHGTSALLYLTDATGAPLIKGKTITGFANSEEDIADSYMGKAVMPFRIQDEATKLGANFITVAAFKPFAVRDGHLITGQQNNSGTETAKLIVEALGKCQ